MKLRSKIAVSAALLGAFTMAHAEAITFGVEIPPIANLIVRDGIMKNAVDMTKTAVDATATTNSEVVGGFTVVTNMPKWNVYFGFANGGALKSQSGRQITNASGNLFLGSVGTAVAAAAGEAAVYVNTTDVIKAVDQTAVTPLALTALPAGAIITSPIVNNGTNRTLTAAMAGTGVTPCAGPLACVFTTPWLTSTDLTTANFDIRTGLESATPVLSVAGSYTETMYITLVTTY